MEINYDANNLASEPLGFRVGEAAEFLVKLLAGTEMPSAEVLYFAKEAGIVKKTLSRAKKIVGAKSWRKNNKWYMSVPEEMRGRTFSIPKPRQKEYFPAPPQPGISSDWIAVMPKIDIPARPLSAGGNLRVKVGVYEFEADGDFPLDKLAEVLRELAVKNE